MFTEGGILCKINSAMIPGTSEQHRIEVNRAVKSRGAFLHSTPLTSAPEHGTGFGLKGQRGPTAKELAALQDPCEDQIKMMRHCQCRADALGLLGDDRSSEFTTEKVMAMDVQYDLETRKAYRAKIDDEPAARITTRQKELGELAGEMSEVKLLAAVAPKARASLMSVLDVLGSSKYTNSRHPASNSSGTVVSTFTARADMARRIGLRASSAPSTTAMLYLWPRLVAAQETFRSMLGSSRSINTRTIPSRNRRSAGSGAITIKSKAVRSGTSSAATPRCGKNR